MRHTTSSLPKCKARVITRQIRAKIRIMHKRGVKASAIARHVKASLSTVYNILKGRYGAEDEGDDRDEVDSAFLREFEPVEDSEGMSSSAQQSSSSGEMSPACNATRPSSTVRRKEDYPISPVLPSIETIETGVSARQLQIVRQSESPLVELRKTSEPATPRPMTETRPTIKVNDTTEPLSQLVPGPHELVTFLTYLEHDLSELATDLERQGINTLAHLLAFASWSEEKLHELFKATLPYLTVPQRFILVHGVKERSM
ncbi:hypothetical protein H0H93_011971 [Arthromyces matolae]|nr:hypothetical protein H0H93_011971 [Arthromyces matolae]